MSGDTEWLSLAQRIRRCLAGLNTTLWFLLAETEQN
jgi:hypothetical protein